MANDSKGPGRSKMRIFGVLVLAFVAGILFTGAFGSLLSTTDEMEFCTSCHSMQTNFEEYQKTIHFKNPSGVRATCSDCHVPKSFFRKMEAKIIAVKDIYHEIVGTIDTPEKFQARRWYLASRVWARMEANDSQECRNCHDFSQMDLSEQERIARKRHAGAMDEGKTCIDCHKGIAHTEPDEPDEPQEQQ